mmetsp:Transcript_13669/g.44289  ORF Transcript_13669/g.44289 Transcript_13669/m.44289 type:complete len:541 (+) Transcript_13669:71-1693(+)
MGACGSSTRVVSPDDSFTSEFSEEPTSAASDGSAQAPAPTPTARLRSLRKRSTSPKLTFIGHCIDRSQFILDKGEDIEKFYNLPPGKLGEGAYGKVSRAVSKGTGEVRAVKSIPKALLSDIKSFNQEVSIMKKLDHPNLIRLYETFEDRKQVFLVMELCAGGELFERLLAMPTRCFSESRTAAVMQDTFRALAYMHGLDLVHRDVKPENILVQSRGPLTHNVLKLIDFGTARPCLEKQVLGTMVGTSYYIAPQVLQRKYGRGCDVWSAGVMMYVLLSGSPPFPGRTDAEIMRHVKRARYGFEKSIWSNVSSDAKDLIRQLMCVDTHARLSAEQALHSAWSADSATSRRRADSLDSLDIERLEAFGHLGSLKQVLLHVVAGQLQDTKRNQFRNQFVHLDSNGDGLVSAEELEVGLAQVGITRSHSDVLQIVASVDTNFSGSIDYTEFVAAALDFAIDVDRDACLTAFNVFDIDGDGVISEDELARLLGLKGDRRSRAKELIELIDCNGDGVIDFDEFHFYMSEGSDVSGACTKASAASQSA